MWQGLWLKFKFLDKHQECGWTRCRQGSGDTDGGNHNWALECWEGTMDDLEGGKGLTNKSTLLTCLSLGKLQVSHFLDVYLRICKAFYGNSMTLNPGDAKPLLAADWHSVSTGTSIFKVWLVMGLALEVYLFIGFIHSDHQDVHQFVVYHHCLQHADIVGVAI